ncbi:hypothetical protein Sj15T_18820 [Sphingobium sp. TA15]|uniref:Uncharacterized protein n=1 Tax=Sphingobium indicum (strain DSM 16413 / CCM 7287 / MTCC 6362 / UT26 / NBRC 101211 / UT26S) TaxID=452662 RepID=D4Z4B3_SPHIU|nr:hypothetical protein [Sphingobium indicum]BAI97445.1 hypothetical protein SJA_C1-26110 [Sphingobium indicum UT26S]BDD66861.1 hypothetical protein Sj15T_18820 [Sphingobium sp. TA15]
MKKLILTLAAVACAISPAVAKEKMQRAWQATRTTDPVTGVSRCVVSALDYVGKTRYSRTGFLYPVIENHPQHGLLVGVSSGGRFRLPTGTILWRVDDQPFREVRPEDGPVTTDMSAMPAGLTPQDPVAAKAMADAMAVSGRAIMAATATSSFAMGDTARAMLAELRAGHGLLFRAKAAAADTGLPDSGMYRVGQITKDGLKPVPLDASLASALADCGI